MSEVPGLVDGLGIVQDEKCDRCGLSIAKYGWHPTVAECRPAVQFDTALVDNETARIKKETAHYERMKVMPLQMAAPGESE